MAADAVTTARSLLRQGLSEDQARARLRAAGFADNEAGDAVREAARDPGGPAGSEQVSPTDSARAARVGRGRSSVARRRPARTRAGRAVGRFETSFDAAAREAGRISLTPPRRVTARDGAGFLVGMLGYVLVLQYIRHGGDGVKGWIAAKFVNKPWTPPDRRGSDRPAAESNGGGLTSTRPRGPVSV